MSTNAPPPQSPPDARSATVAAGSSAPPPGSPALTILVVEFFSRGGLFHYALQLGQAMAQPGCRVILLTARNPEAIPRQPPPNFALWANLRTWNPRRPCPRALLFWRRLGHALTYGLVWLQILWFARRARPQVMLFSDLEHRCDAWFCALLRAAGIALADICHNVSAFDRTRRVLLVRRPAWRDRMLARMALVFVHSEAQAREFYHRTGRPAIRIPHGVGELYALAAGPDPGLRQRLQLPPDRPVALLFGTLAKYKGIEWLLRALAALAAAERPSLVIAGFPGADSELAAWMQLGRDLDVADWLRWRPEYVPLSQVAWYFRLADFVVLPYYLASQSGIAHLALAFAKPIIASDSGGLPEVVASGVNGFVVPVGDVPALADALKTLATRPDLRAAMDEASRLRAAGQHDWAAIGCRLTQEFAAFARPPARTRRPAARASQSAPPPDV